MTVEAGRSSRPASLPMPAPTRTRDLAWLLLLSMAAAAAVLSYRGRHPGAQVEAVPRTPVSMDSLAREPAPPPWTSRTREIREAMRRGFEDAVAGDARRAVVGDFNGDGAEDLAVVARPARGALDRVNHELANWTVQDALVPQGAGRARSARVTVAEGDVVLAVIHGYGAAGWRDSHARQSYLVRNVSHARPRVVQDGRGLAHGSLRLRGAVIVVPGRPGFLYWSGSRYVFAPLRSAAATR